MNDTVTVTTTAPVPASDIVSTVAAQTPERASEMLTHITRMLRLKNDAALARVLEVAPPVVSKIRNGRIPFGASMIIRAHEITGLSIRAIKEQLGEKSLNRYAA